MKPLFVLCALVVLLAVPGLAQAPDQQQHPGQYILKGLDAAHAKPDKIDDILSRFGQFMMDKGADQKTVDARLNAVYPIFQQAARMDNDTYKQQRQALARQVWQTWIGGARQKPD